MHFSRTTITAGLAALSLAVSAAPALARGGGDINNTVVSTSGTITTTAPEPAPLNGWDLCPDYAGVVTQADGSDPSKLYVEIPDPFTGDRHFISVEPGKTKIR